ncbi:hypothetical protein [Microbispora corallina]|uniref:hypothetical protein n=1 Tax=Microbispora corallina TaxID=83302 RepID=UPI001951341B|nr:hypothetical protein [Microbispora corallina]
MSDVLAVVLGIALILTVWSSVLRTVMTPQTRSSRVALWTLRAVTTAGHLLARRLPRTGRQRVLELCAPAAVFSMAAAWLAASFAGFGLVAAGLYGVRPHPDDLAEVFLMRSPGAALAAAAWLSSALMLAAFTAHLLRIIDAFGRRERFVARLAGQAIRPPDAEAVLAGYVRSGSRDHLDDLFAEWAGWLADVGSSHVAYPVLTFQRPAGRLCWLKAAVIVMDAAALTEAVAPDWAPPHARTVLDTGTHCLQRVAAQLGVVVHPAVVSLQGREERAFADTMRLAVGAGLPRERDERTAEIVFQDLRRRYAPYSTGIAARIFYESDTYESPPDDGVGAAESDTPLAC